MLFFEKSAVIRANDKNGRPAKTNIVLAARPAWTEQHAMTTKTDKTNANEKYKAPALEKGLDILELLAKAEGPLSTLEIASRLKRSKAELYRMLQVLEARGYVGRNPGDDRFLISRKVLELGTEGQPISDLLEYALPVMRNLAQEISQSCHIAVPSREKIVVISRVETQSALNFSVRVGYSQAIPMAVSGRVLFAFQAARSKESWLKIMKEAGVLDDETAFIAACKKIQKRGFETADSTFVKGVRDISAPIIELDHAVAALTVPYIEKKSYSPKFEDATAAVVAAAQDISSALKFGSVRGL